MSSDRIGERLVRGLRVLGGVAVVVTGVVWAVLGAWGMSRGSADAWGLALLGVAATAGGLWLVLGSRPPRVKG